MSEYQFFADAWIIRFGFGQAKEIKAMALVLLRLIEFRVISSLFEFQSLSLNFSCVLLKKKAFIKYGQLEQK